MLKESKENKVTKKYMNEKKNAQCKDWFRAAIFQLQRCGTFGAPTKQYARKARSQSDHFCQLNSQTVNVLVRY